MSCKSRTESFIAARDRKTQAKHFYTWHRNPKPQGCLSIHLCFFRSLMKFLFLYGIVLKMPSQLKNVRRRTKPLAWRELNCAKFRDYFMRYLESDVRLLYDVFEEFRRMNLRLDGLDPVHFVSLLYLSFMYAFKMTRETIHRLQDSHFRKCLFQKTLKTARWYKESKMILKNKRI